MLYKIITGFISSELMVGVHTERAKVTGSKRYDIEGTGIDVAWKLLQDRMHVNSLILLDAVGLYTQSLCELLRNYVQEIIHSVIKTEHSFNIDQVTLLKAQNKQYMREGIAEMFRQMRLDERLDHYL